MIIRYKGLIIFLYLIKTTRTEIDVNDFIRVLVDIHGEILTRPTTIFPRYSASFTTAFIRTTRYGVEADDVTLFDSGRDRYSLGANDNARIIPRKLDAAPFSCFAGNSKCVYLTVFPGRADQKSAFGPEGLETCRYVRRPGRKNADRAIPTLEHHLLDRCNHAMRFTVETDVAMGLLRHSRHGPIGLTHPLDEIVEARVVPFRFKSPVMEVYE